MKNRIMAFVTCLVVCCTFMLSGFESFAKVVEFKLNYAEPEVSEFSGYCNVITLNSSGGYGCQTYFWSMVPMDSGIGTYMDIRYDSSNQSVSFYPTLPDAYNGNSNQATYSLCVIYNNGKCDLLKQGIGAGVPTSYKYTANSGTNIVAIIPQGNYRLSSKPSMSDTYNIIFGEDTLFYNILNSLLSVLNQNQELLDEYMPLLSDILSNTDYMSSALSDLYDLVDVLLDDINSNHAEMLEQNQAIYDELYELKEHLIQNDGSMNDFEDSSSNQSNQLNDLNQDTQVNKPNVDDMSSTVDQNLNVDIDTNYGMLLSAFTTNNRILTMLLIVASISLISFVLFGKR